MAESQNSAVVSGPTFFQRVELELKKLFTRVPGWEASAAATLTYVAPLIETLVALAEPEAVPAVTALVSKVQSALAGAAVVVKDAGPTPTLVIYLQAINRDLAEVEAAAQVKDPTTASTLNATVAAVTAEMNEILAVVGSPAVQVAA